VRGEIEGALSEQFGRTVGLELVVDPGAEPPRSRSGAAPEPARPAAAGSDTADPGGSSGPSARSATTVRGPDLGEPDRAGGFDDADEPPDFDEAELGELVDVDNSAEARVRQAFPGAEEVG